jgi:uncharacterized protein HemX
MADTDVLEEIKDKLVSLEGKADTAKESKDNGGLWGWIVALVVGAAVSIGAALLIWKLNKKNEELAKLRTQIEQDEVKDAQLQHEIAVADHQAKIDTLAAEAAEVRTRIVANSIKLDEETTRHAEVLTRVEAARDWDQLDALNRENR